MKVESASSFLFIYFCTLHILLWTCRWCHYGDDVMMQSQNLRNAAKIVKKISESSVLHAYFSKCESKRQIREQIRRRHWQWASVFEYECAVPHFPTRAQSKTTQTHALSHWQRKKPYLKIAESQRDWFDFSLRQRTLHLQGSQSCIKCWMGWTK